MALNAGSAYINVIPRPTGWRGLGKAIAIAGPLAAVGAGALSVGKKFHEMRSAIITGTGASGKALKDLEASAKRVGTQTPEDFKTVGQAIAEMNTATGATGKPLEKMTKSVLNASRLLGEDGVENSKSFGRALNQWQIPAEKGAQKADMLFAASQKYGIGLGETTNALRKYGGTLQNAGFSMDESVAMFGRLQKGGISLQRAMPGLNMAFRKWAEEGKNSKEELGKTIEQMKNAETGSEALAIATETFGAEGAQQMVSAARSGSLSMKDLSKDLKNTEGAVADADKRNRTFAESWQILKNKGMAQVEPIATAIFNALIKGMVWLERSGIPTLKKMAGFIKDNSTAFKALTIIVGVAVTGLVAYRLTVGTVNRITKIWTFLTKGATAATKGQTIAQRVLNTVMRLNPIGLVVTALTLLVGGFILAYKKSETFRRIVDKAFGGVKKAGGSTKDFLLSVFSKVRGALDKTGEFFVGLWKGVKAMWQKTREFTMQGALWVIDKMLWFAEKMLGVAVRAFGWAPGIGDKLKAAQSKVRDFRKGVNRELNQIRDENVNIKATTSGFTIVKGRNGTPIRLPEGMGGRGGKIRAEDGSMVPRTFYSRTSGMAHGGPVRGGQRGRDSVPKMLMPDEHVWTASEVRNAGGHGAMLAWRRQVAMGGPNFRMGKMPNISGFGESMSRGFSVAAYRKAMQTAKVLHKIPQLVPGMGATGPAGRVLRPGTYSIGMPYLGYPGHYGADYPAPTGTPVFAMRSGQVSRALSLSTSYGKHAFLRHPGGAETRYAHMNALGVRAGQRVRAGQQIGTVGSTGNSTGPHLHFEYRRNGRAINPASLGIFDGGGELNPGMLAYHSTRARKPDKVLTDQQFSDIHKLAMSGGGGQRTVNQFFPVTDGAAATAAAGRASSALEAKGI